MLTASALASLLLFAAQASGEVLLSSREPDPGYNDGAMQVWLRADSGVTASNGAVSRWKDKSRHGNDATQANPAYRPTLVKRSFGEREAIAFSGGGKHLAFATGFDHVFDGSFTVISLLAPDDGYPNRDSVWFGLAGGPGPAG